MNFNRIILLNQVVGPLFYELSLSLSSQFKGGGILLFGNIVERDIKQERESKLLTFKLPKYNRKNVLIKFVSWINYSINTCFYISKLRKDDVLLISSNPPIMIVFLYLILYVKNLPYVLLIYDIYPNVIINKSFFTSKSWIIRIYNYINSIIYNRASKIITLSQSMKKIIHKDFKVEKKFIQVIEPWVDINKILPLRKKENPFKKKYIGNCSFVVLYSGNMGISHDIESILDSAKSLKDINDILFLLIGGGAKFEFAKNYINDNDLKNIRILPFQKQEKLPFSLSLADISIVSVDQGMEDLILPSKTFYYLAAGSAIIGITNSPSDLGKLIKKGEIGFIVSPNSPSQLTKYILKLYKNKKLLNRMKLNSRKLVEANFSVEKGTSKFSNIFRNI